MSTAPTERPPRNILVRAPNPVGDVVMATASFADIRRSFPDAHIAMLLRPGRDLLLEGSTTFDEVIIDPSGAGIRNAWRLARALRRRRFDLCILFTNSLRSALVAAVSGTPVRVGYCIGGQRLLLTHPVRPAREGRKHRPIAMAEFYARLCEAAGVERGDGWPRLAVPAACEEAARARRRELGIAEGEELIGLVPGAAFGASKLWPTDQFARLADRLTDTTGRRTIIFGGPGEEAICANLADAMRTTPINTCERPLGLGLLKPFVRDLKLMVTMDTGPRHVAVAFRVPTVVVMGPTDPRWTAANLDVSEIVRHDVECGPCQLPACPTDHRCMTEITSEEVLERVEALARRLDLF